MKTNLLLQLCFTALLASPSSGAPDRPEPPSHKRQAIRTRANPMPANLVPIPSQLGAPLSGITPEQAADFRAGMAEFENVESPDGGLGPVFNNVSCVTCHADGATGGGGVVTVTRYGRLEKGVFNPLTEFGGTLLHQNTINLGVREDIPPEANLIAHRQSTPLFGLGLIEAIPDADLQRAAAQPPRDGVKGRAALIQDVATGQMRVGRFGWKAQQATLLGFAGDAYLNEMGVTSRLFPTETAPNGDAAPLAIYDTVADPEDQVDPETGKGDIDLAADFMRFLAPPPPGPQTPGSTAGRALFQQINCALCHTPVLNTGAHAVEALNRKPVPLYSDLLLHDMGTLGDGIAQSAAAPKEMRTAPLWGLRFSAPYLHDGRAATIDEAIRAHDGQGQASRDRYLRLSPTQRQQLTDFLRSL